MLVGKLGRCGQGFCPIFYMMPAVYASCVFALRENNDILYSTHKVYRKLTRKVKCKPKYEDETQEIWFTIGQATRNVHEENIQDPSLDQKRNHFSTKAVTRRWCPLGNSNWPYHPQRSRLGTSVRCM